ncbi:MAG: hypothetical protein H6835_10910 [Planctomycetes bacterium]|nr:hypothetical protein [Planctomycetota bacterium]
MIDVLVSIYLASKTRWAHLQKTVVMPAAPRVGEWLKLRNEEQGDYFGFRVCEVTHREDGCVELMTELLDDVGGRGYSFAEEPEFDDYYRSYLACGWQGRVKANRRLDHITSAADGAVEVRLSQSPALVLFDLLSREPVGNGATYLPASNAHPCGSVAINSGKSRKRSSSGHSGRRLPSSE